MMVDAGHLFINSILVDRKFRNEIMSKHGSTLSVREFETLKSFMYDRFACRLTSVQVGSPPLFFSFFICLN